MRMVTIRFCLLTPLP